MTPTATFLTSVSVLEILAAVWIIGLIFPMYQISQGKVRGLLGAVLLLFGALIATSVFWIFVLVTPSELRQPGTWLYVMVVVGFVAVQVMPLLTGMYLWRQMRQ